MDNPNETEFRLLSGDDVVKVSDALSHPTRVKIMGILYGGRQYVSELARKASIREPLI
jgi:DNA-binding transcriptional ArsR family regulator